MINELPIAPDPAIHPPGEFSMVAATFVLAQRAMVPQINQAIAQFNAIAAGGAYAIPYVFDTTTTDADPGPGRMRLSNVTQNAATAMRLDLTAAGQDFTSVLDTFDASTSSVKGSIRLIKLGDPSKWMVFDVIARAAPAGYRNMTVTCIGSSSASPFANGDGVLVCFQRNGDKGERGNNGFSNMVVLESSAPWVGPAGVFKGKVTVVDGGCGGEKGASGDAVFWPGGPGGPAGVSVVNITPGATYNGVVGLGSAQYNTGASPNPGGVSSFTGPGVSVTAANAQLKIPGGQGEARNYYANTTGNTRRSGGGSLLAAPGSGGPGCGGRGGYNSFDAEAGFKGVIIIEF